MSVSSSPTLRRASRIGMSLGAGLLGVAVMSVHAEGPATSGIARPEGDSVRVDKNPLSRRSATENVVFGRIVSTDDHRLTIREGQGESVSETVYRLSPRVRVISGDREIELSDLPESARIRFQRGSTAETEISELYVVNDDETGQPEDSAKPRTTRVLTNDDAPSASTEVVPPVKLGATLETTPDGIAVVRLDNVSPLADAGMKAGDYITFAAGDNVKTPDGLFRVLNQFDGGEKVELKAMRDDEELEFTLVLPDDHERVRVKTSANNVARSPRSDDNLRGARVNNSQMLRQILENQQRQQAQLNYLHEALQRVVQAAGLNDNVLGSGFGLVGGLPIGGDGGTGSDCYCAIGTNPQGNPVIGFTQNGTAVAVVGYDAAGTPILAETTIATPGQPEVVADGLTDADQDGDGLPDGQDRDGDGFPRSPTANAGADQDCVCPLGTDVNGKPVIGVTQKGVPVAVVGVNANGNPILAETSFAANNQAGDAGTGQPGESDGRPPVKAIERERPLFPPPPNPVPRSRSQQNQRSTSPQNP